MASAVSAPCDLTRTGWSCAEGSHSGATGVPPGQGSPSATRAASSCEDGRRIIRRRASLARPCHSRRCGDSGTPAKKNEKPFLALTSANWSNGGRRPTPLVNPPTMVVPASAAAPPAGGDCEQRPEHRPPPPGRQPTIREQQDQEEHRGKREYEHDLRQPPGQAGHGQRPGAATSPRSAYCSVIMVAASDSPTRHSTQPMALRGTRLAITWPVPAYTTTATALKT